MAAPADQTYAEASARLEVDIGIEDEIADAILGRVSRRLRSLRRPHAL